MNAPRSSPVADLHPAGASLRIAGMPVPAGGEWATLPPVALADCSARPKFGCKGAAAADWLRAAGLPLPAAANHWLPYRGGLVARLGRSEYLLEAGDEDWVSPLQRGDDHPPELVTVARCDASLLLAGARVHELLLQVCSYDFDAVDATTCPLMMTMMIGVSVVVVPLPGTIRAYRLWCDPSFAAYLYRELLQIATELGGAVIGWRDVLIHLPDAVAFGTNHPPTGSPG